MRELAARAGISHTAISMIEKNEISPSVDTLAAILDVLGSTLVSFFAELKGLYSVSPFYRADDLPEIGERKKISYKAVGQNHPNRSILLLHETYQAGADSGKAISHDAQETGIVISGAVEVTVGTETSILYPGDAYYFDSRLPHTFKNVHEGESVIVSAVSPPSF